MSEPTLIQTDGQGRTVLRGHPNKRYLMRENEDGSILLKPATVLTAAHMNFSRRPNCKIYSPGRLRCRLSVDSINAADEYQRAGWLIRQVLAARRDWDPDNPDDLALASKVIDASASWPSRWFNVGNRHRRLAPEIHAT